MMQRCVRYVFLTLALVGGVVGTSKGMEEAVEAPCPALIQAVWDRDAATVQGLLAAGTDINVRDANNGRTALMTAARTGNLEIMNILLAHRADATLYDNDEEKNTALMFAVTFHDATLAGNMTTTLLGVAQDMINAQNLFGAYWMINARDSEGRTVLMLATMYGNGAAVQALLAHPYHADPRVPNNDGEDALDIARKVGNPVITHDIEAAMTVRGIVLDHNALRDATAQEWPELPREVFDHEILPFLE